MTFERMEVVHPAARVAGWLADRDGIHEDSRRGFGGQSRTALALFDEDAFARCRLFGWISSVRAKGGGASRAAIEELIEAMARRGADVVGLMVVPDDDAYVERLASYYERLGFRTVGSARGWYPVMVMPLAPCAGVRPPAPAAARDARTDPRLPENRRAIEAILKLARSIVHERNRGRLDRDAIAVLHDLLLEYYPAYRHKIAWADREGLAIFFNHQLAFQNYADEVRWAHETGGRPFEGPHAAFREVPPEDVLSLTADGLPVLINPLRTWESRYGRRPNVWRTGIGVYAPPDLQRRRQRHLAREAKKKR